jgi:hypothetical protein
MWSVQTGHSSKQAILTFLQFSNTCSASEKSMGQNFAMTPSRCISCAQLSGPSSTMHFTCSDMPHQQPGQSMHMGQRYEVRY